MASATAASFDSVRRTQHPLFFAVDSLDRTTKTNEWMTPNIRRLISEYAAEMVQPVPSFPGAVGAVLFAGKDLFLFISAEDPTHGRTVHLLPKRATVAVVVTTTPTPIPPPPSPPTSLSVTHALTCGIPPGCVYSPIDQCVYQSVPANRCIRSFRADYATGGSRDIRAISSDSFGIGSPLGLHAYRQRATAWFQRVTHRYLLACDPDHGRVAHFEFIGTNDSYIEHKAIGFGIVNCPVAVTRGAEDSRTYIVDAATRQLSVFCEYSFVGHFGQDVMTKPTSVVAWKHLLFVADPPSGKIHRFDTRNGHVRYDGFFGTDHRLMAESANDLSYVHPRTLTCAGNRLFVMDSKSTATGAATAVHVIPLA